MAVFKFQPTRPLRGATNVAIPSPPYFLRFQPTRPLRGATTLVSAETTPTEFQPTRPLRGATQPATVFPASRSNFNPRAPCGARRDFQLFMKRLRKISTHAPLAGRDEQRGIQPKAGEISTHAPLAGRDSRIYAPSQCVRYFNPRAPCGARRLLGWVSSWTSTFRSTRPLRGATIAPVATSESIEISTHAPLAGRDK